VEEGRRMVDLTWRWQVRILIFNRLNDTLYMIHRSRPIGHLSRDVHVVHDRVLMKRSGLVGRINLSIRIDVT
jgi:hypothetical protein